MTEGERHSKAVARVKTMLILENYHIYENDYSRGWGGYKFPTIMTDKGPKGWTADIFVQSKSGRCFVVEIDGHLAGQGHFSKHNQIDDDFRDETLQKFGVATVRLDVDWLVGKEAQSDEQIMREIRHWLDKKFQICLN